MTHIVDKDQSFIKWHLWHNVNNKINAKMIPHIIYNN
jgi:hypothetical protein